MLNKVLDFLLCFFYLLPIRITEISANNESICALQQTCSECLQTPYCIWCSEAPSDQNNGLFTRCITRSSLEKNHNWCSSDYIIDNESRSEILENRILYSGKNGDPVQIQPQRMRISLRLGEEQIVKLKYSKAIDYPVDLYYLMDLSFSMEPYREQLSNLGDKLAEAMVQLTSNFRLGFGSFVDKVALPMTNIQPNMLMSPCIRSTGETCAPPYGFKNQMPLTENLSLFKSNVKEAPVSGNLDGLEGGFDAIMQAIVCTEKIGWREKARHLLVFSTDAGFHIAGDGRLAGITVPNDELCHLDKNGFYNYSLLQDYPSISQINRKVEEYNINIIFAVPKSMNRIYQILSESISGSSIGLLENDSRNVVSLVSKEYEKLVDSVTMTDDSSKIIDISYFSKCLNENSILKEGRVCNGLRKGNVVEFQIVLKAVKCPTNSSEWHQTIKIGPRGVNESLELNVELICNCPCEQNQERIQKSPICKDHGNLTCGICKCDSGFNGKQCECKGSDLDSTLFEGCIANNESKICSGRGTCKCGICECSKRINSQEEFYGRYCECDNFSCKRSNGLICGGQGKCDCGSCSCLPGWIGETCNCKESNSTCIPLKESNIVCSDRGDCICGSCQCYESKNGRYLGRFCEESSTRYAQPCEELKDCVECLAYNSGPLSRNNQCVDCSRKLNITHRVQKWLEAENEGNDIQICQMPAEGSCSFTFKYKLVQNITEDRDEYFEVVVQQEKDCPTPVNVMGITLGVAISTVILGLCILLLWKLIITIHDRKEYARFEKEKVLVKWEKRGNPFYKEATTTFKNPTFQGH